MLVTIDSATLESYENTISHLRELNRLLRDQEWLHKRMLRSASAFDLGHGVSVTRVPGGDEVSPTWIIKQGDKVIMPVRNAFADKAFNAAFDVALMIEVNSPDTPTENSEDA